MVLMGSMELMLSLLPMNILAGCSTSPLTVTGCQISLNMASTIFREKMGIYEMKVDVIPNYCVM